MRSTANIAMGVAAGLIAASCATTYRTLSADHCANQEGNDWCSSKYPDGSRPYCSRGVEACEAWIALNSEDLDGCIAERPTDDACYSPCGGRMSVAEDGSCVGEESSSSGSEASGSSSTGSSESSGASESSTTGPMPCVGNEDCQDEAAPFCEPAIGECVSCDATDDPDGSCAGLDPLRPLCVNQDCVACTPENPLVCDEQLLLCDGGTNACVPCTEHAQCSSGACELAAGTCFPPDTVVHVDGDGGQDYPNVAAAVMSIGAGLQGVIIVHEQDSGLGYASAVVDAGKIVALLAAPGETPTLQGTAGNPGLTVQGAGTTAYVDGLAIANSPMGLGVRVDGAFAWVDRSRIVQNSGGGVVAENGAELTLRNCFVGSLGDVIGVAVDGASASVLYSTVTASTFGSTPAMGCTMPVVVDIRNSIIVSQGGTSPDELDCASATMSSTATEADVGAFNLGWFVGFNTGDFALSPAGALAFGELALWATGDPLTDIDGDPRPAVDGTPDYAGADVP